MSGRAAGAPDDDDSVQSRLASSNGALQNLLARLGTGIEDLMPSGGRVRMKELLASLKDHDEGRQMEALNELCDVLSMGQEEILIGFNIDAFLPVLVELLNYEHNPEIMLLSCRAITHLLEVLPKSAAKVVGCGAVPLFCQRLLTIEFIDVAEQSLLAMHKLSTEHPEPLLRANGLAAALSFIDFFDINTQRTAAATAANMCRNIAEDLFVDVAQMIPNLTQLLSIDDQKIVESAVLCFVRLVESFSSSEAQLEDIANHGMLNQLLRLLRPRNQEGRSFEVSTGTYTSIVKTLSLSCRGSSKLAVSLLEQDIIKTVHAIINKEEDAQLSGTALMTSGLSGGLARIEALLRAVVAVKRPVEQLLHTLVLANELLPPVQVTPRF
ncbi:armadillo-type protein [Baffinella frigidus]|nr:armadillo-type protein [Cryptophyta sp. CCMP2293]